MAGLVDAGSDPNANAPALWIQSHPSLPDLPNHRPREGEHRHPPAEARTLRHPRGGQGEAGPSILSVTAVVGAPSLQTQNIVNALVDPMSPLSLLIVPIRAEDLMTTLLKESHNHLCLGTVALLFPTMRDQRRDDSRGTTRGHQVDRIQKIGVVWRKVATGVTGIGTRAVVDTEVLRQNKSHRGSAV